MKNLAELRSSLIQLTRALDDAEKSRVIPSLQELERAVHATLTRRGEMKKVYRDSFSSPEYAPLCV